MTVRRGLRSIGALALAAVALAGGGARAQSPGPSTLDPGEFVITSLDLALDGQAPGAAGMPRAVVRHRSAEARSYVLEVADRAPRRFDLKLVRDDGGAAPGVVGTWWNVAGPSSTPDIVREGGGPPEEAERAALEPFADATRHADALVGFFAGRALAPGDRLVASPRIGPALFGASGAGVRRLGLVVREVPSAQTAVVDVDVALAFPGDAPLVVDARGTLVVNAGLPERLVVEGRPRAPAGGSFRLEQRFTYYIEPSFTPFGQLPASVTALGRRELTWPEVISKVDPVYPPRYAAARAGGHVAITLVVDQEGVPREPEITASGGAALDQSALDAVRLWRFRPASYDGRPIAVRFAVSVLFKMR